MDDKIKEMLQAMTMKELSNKAAEESIPLPKRYRKDEAVDYLAEQFAQRGIEISPSDDEPEAEQPTDPLEEQAEEDATEESRPQEMTVPAHIRLHQQDISKAEKEVAQATIDVTNTQARLKAEKRRLTSLTEKLIELHMSEPEPTLFDEDSEGLPKDKRELLAKCPTCMGRTCDEDGNECETCGGTGQAKPGDEFVTGGDEEDESEEEDFLPVGFAEPDDCEPIPA